MMLAAVILLALIFLSLISHPSIARNLPGVLIGMCAMAIIGACLWLLIAGGVTMFALYPEIIAGIAKRVLVWGGPAVLALIAIGVLRDRRRNGPMTQLAEKEKALAESLRAWRARERLRR